METQGQADLRTGVCPNRVNGGRSPLGEVLARNALVTFVFQPNDNVVPNQGMNYPPVNQNPEGTINLNAYVDQSLAEFHQQLTGLNHGTVTVNRLIFSLTIEQYEIPPGVKLPKMTNLYLGASSMYEHLDNYAVHMALNHNHDVLKYKLFRITLGNYARTWCVNLPQGSIGSFFQLAEKFTTQFSSCKLIQ